MKQKTKRMLVRMPEEQKAWLESEADKNLTTQNAEVVRAIRECMDRQRVMVAA
jgi:hypothetical protein